MNLERRNMLFLCVLAVLVGTASGQTVLVTTSADVVDVAPTATIAALPGPDGRVSLREALIATDNTPGHQTVGFAIPAEDWYLPWLFPGLVLLRGTFNWSASDSVTIDGTTQTAFTGDTNPDGNEVVLYGISLYLGGDGSVVTGLHDSRVEVSGSGAEVYGNTGSMYVNVFFGSGSLVHDNEAYTIKVDRSNDNVIVGNTTLRVRVNGWFGGGQPAANNRIGGPDPADRNSITGWGNYGEHGLPSGTTVELFDTVGTLVENNYVGTTSDGMDFGSTATTIGVGFFGENHDATVTGNLVAVRGVGTWPAYFGKLFGSAVYIEGSGSGIDVVGNSIGLNAAGDAVLGSVYGVQFGPYNFFGLDGVRIGGTGPGEGNVIAGHLSTGVLVAQTGLQGPDDVRISGNAIYGNAEIAIDLTPDSGTFGRTVNDPFDADAGANGLQNFPSLADASLAGTTIRVVGELRSEPLGDYTIEIFASPECGPMDTGQGHVLLGTTMVTTDVQGSATFDVALPALVPEGWVVASTATHEPVGATSEFSDCVPVQEIPSLSTPWVRMSTVERRHR